MGKGDTGTDNNSTNEGQDSIKWMIIAPLRTKDVTEVPCDLQSASKSSSSAQFVILGFGLRNWSKGSVVPFLEDMLSCPRDRSTQKGLALLDISVERQLIAVKTEVYLADARDRRQLQ